MTIKLIVILASLLLNQNDVLFEQHDAAVSVGDVDSYMHDLPSNVRKDIAYDDYRLETDMLGMINMNIIYDYLKKSGLIEKDEFKTIVKQFKKKKYKFDEEFIQTLRIEESSFKSSYQEFQIKKALYAYLKEYIQNQISPEKAENLAHDRFKLINKSLAKPEYRDISLIELPQSDYSQSDAISMVNELIKNDTADKFSEYAAKTSVKNTEKYKDGQLGQFHEAGFPYPFAETVFASEQSGIVPTIFDYNGQWYICRVNEITQPRAPDFNEYKDKLIATIVEESMNKKFQSIIDEYAQHELEINKESVDSIFSRYEVFQ